MAGERVSLDSLVYAFRRSASPESIRRSFPALTLEQVYGAITFYLAHEQEVDAYLEESEHRAEAQGAEMNASARFAASLERYSPEMTGAHPIQHGAILARSLR